MGIFGRYTQSFERLPEDGFRLAVSAGLVVLQPFGANSDRIGIAYIFDDPSDAALRSEHGIELFWRLQLTQLLSVTSARLGSGDVQMRTVFCSPIP